MQNSYPFFPCSAYLKALLFLLAIPLFGILNAQTTLAPGDAVFTLMNLEGNNEDAFGFVLLSAVEAGTQISVTDKEYTTGTGFEAFEGHLTITFTTAFPCGTEVIITDMDPDPPVYAFGTTTPGITVSDNTDQGFQLSTAGETLVMYQGDNHVSPCSTCFVTALANTGVGFGVAATGSGDLPPGLVVGQSAMAMTANPDGNEWDNIKYNCSLTQEAPNVLRPALLNPANWLTDGSSPFPATPCSPAFACEAVCAPVITGVELVDCSEGPFGQVTLRVIGELNGAAQWQWTGGSNTGQSCTDDALGIAGTGEQLTVQFIPSALSWTFYVRANGGCLTEPVCFAYVPNEVYGIATLSLANTSYCTAAGIQTGLGGGIPTGGIYSGPGVTDDGNGMTFSFDPATAGAGTQTITYTLDAGTICGASSPTATITVNAPPTVAFTPSVSEFTVGTVVTAVTGGSPTGGVYSGPGVTDNGNGMSFSFDPSATGAGTQTITYTFTDANTCTSAANAMVTVTALALPGDVCNDANDISPLFGGPINEAQVSATQDNTGYNADNDPGAGYECWFGDAPVLNNTIWYAFTGDGEKYGIRAIACGDAPMANTDTQFALYSGDCTTPTAVACNDDEDFDNQGYNSYLEIVTEAGVDYLLMVDGYVAAVEYAAIGNFCLEVTRLETVGVTDISTTEFKVYPNPTTGNVQLPQLELERMEVYDATGRLVLTQQQPGYSVDLSNHPAGLYFLKMYTGKEVYSAKVVKE